MQYPSKREGSALVQIEIRPLTVTITLDEKTLGNVQMVRPTAPSRALQLAYVRAVCELADVVGASTSTRKLNRNFHQRFDFLLPQRADLDKLGITRMTVGNMRRTIQENLIKADWHGESYQVLDTREGSFIVVIAISPFAILAPELPVAALLVCQKFIDGKIQSGEVLLNVLYPNLPILFLHEVAHHYDLHCFDPFTIFSSEFGEEFDLWRQAIDSTQSFQLHRAFIIAGSGRLRGQLESSSGRRAELPIILSKDQPDFLYVEAFARCFCQWIVRKWAQDQPKVAAEIVAHFNMEQGSTVSQQLHYYWTEDEMRVLDGPMCDLFLNGNASL